MIYIFRKEMKKWKNVLWLVFASFVLGGLSFVFMKKQDPRYIPIAKVDGEEIPLNQYKLALNQVNETIDMYKNYARAYGGSIDMFLNMLGLSNPMQAALNRCIKNKLIDKIQRDLKIELDDKLFDDELAKTIPQYLLEPSGKINIRAYRNYLSRLGTTIPDYEEEMRQNFSRELVGQAVRISYYLPLNEIKSEYESENLEKNFRYIHFLFDDFLNKAKKEPASDNTLKDYYQKNKENYRIGKKVKISYWPVDVKLYESKVKIDEDTIINYYNRNKTTLFRIPPKVKVRHIFFALPDLASPDQAEVISKKAKNVFEQVKKDPKAFAELAKKYSEDEKTKSSGGLIDFFDKGTYDTEFEKAAFRLKKVDQVSDVVKTKNGLEIIKLEERIHASEKPLKEVRDQISKTLKAKKALSSLRGDIESLLYRARSDQDEILKFMDRLKIDKMHTDWLSNENADGEKVENLLAKKFFSKQKSSKNYGYIINDGKYIVYLLENKKNSYLPKFEDVKNSVISDYYSDIAEKKLKKAVKKAKKDLILRQTTLEKIAEDMKSDIKETGMIKKGGKILGISDDANLANFIFLLNDKLQVLKHKIDRDYFLFQIIDSQKIDQKDFDNKKHEIIQKNWNNNSQHLFEAFVDSLQRNVKIEKLDKFNETNIGSEI